MIADPLNGLIDGVQQTVDNTLNTLPQTAAATTHNLVQSEEAVSAPAIPEPKKMMAIKKSMLS